MKDHKLFKKNIDGVIIAAVVWAVVAQVLHTAEFYLTISYYQLPEYLSLWSKILMPGQGSPPAEFFYTSIAFNFMVGLIFALFYIMFSYTMPMKGILKRGLVFGWILFLVSTVPGILTLLLFINLPFELLAIWTLTGLAIDFIGGVGIVKVINRPKKPSS